MVTIYKLFTFNRNFNKPLAYTNMSFPKDVFFIGRCKVGFFIESDFFSCLFFELAVTGPGKINPTKMENPQCASGWRGGKRGFGMIGGAELNDKTQEPAFLIFIKICCSQILLNFPSFEVCKLPLSCRLFKNAKSDNCYLARFI